MLHMLHLAQGGEKHCYSGRLPSEILFPWAFLEKSGASNKMQRLGVTTGAAVNMRLWLVNDFVPQCI